MFKGLFNKTTIKAPSSPSPASEAQDEDELVDRPKNDALNSPYKSNAYPSPMGKASMKLSTKIKSNSRYYLDPVSSVLNRQSTFQSPFKPKEKLSLSSLNMIKGAQSQTDPKKKLSF